MEKMRKMLKLSRKEMKVLKIAVFTSLFILSSATVAASVEVKKGSKSYHSTSYTFSLLGGLRG